MLFGLALRAAFKSAFAALATIVLVAAPLAEAATCAAEQPADIVAVDTPAGVVSDDADRSTQQPDSQHCVHGHCHHVTACQGSLGEAERVLTDDQGLAPVETPIRLERLASGLERPPKA